MQSEQSSAAIASQGSEDLLKSYTRQECFEEADRFELSGKAITDMVVVSLDLKVPHSILEVSTLYQLTTDACLANTGTQSIMLG